MARCKCPPYSLIMSLRRNTAWVASSPTTTPFRLILCLVLVLAPLSCRSGEATEEREPHTSGDGDGDGNDGDGDGDELGDGDGRGSLGEFFPAMAALNDTGIAFGSDENRNGADCSVTVLATDGVTPLEQDCAQGRSVEANSQADGANGFDFTRLNADGSEYTGNGDYVAEPWACVRDNRTGLMWEVKSTDGGLHDSRGTYRWGGLTALDRDNPSREGDYYDDWNELIIGTNTASLCGYSDWRVPNNGQLMSILHFGKSGLLKIDTDFFPNTVGEFYWSSAPYRGEHGEFYAWAFQLVFGTNKNIQRYQPGALRLVRAIDSASSTSPRVEETPDSRYSSHGDGTVTDLATGLMWAQCVVGVDGLGCESGSAEAMTWAKALEYAQNSELAGHADWRLPNNKELFSLVDFNRVEPAINLNVFPATTVEYTWSSSPMIEFPQDSWFINFKTGLNWFKGRSSDMLVRLVRAGTDNLQLSEGDTQDGEAIDADDALGSVAGEMDPVDVHAQILIHEAGYSGDPTIGRDLPSINEPKAQLGKALFYSKRLSGEYDTACASCHHPMPVTTCLGLSVTTRLMSSTGRPPICLGRVATSAAVMLMR